MLHHFFAADGAALPWLATAVVSHSSQEQVVPLEWARPQDAYHMMAVLLRLGYSGGHYMLHAGFNGAAMWHDMTGSAHSRAAGGTFSTLLTDQGLKVPSTVVAPGQQSLLLVVAGDRGSSASDYYARVHAPHLGSDPYYFQQHRSGNPERRQSHFVAQGAWFVNTGWPAIVKGVHPVGGYEVNKRSSGGGYIECAGAALASQGDGIWSSSYTGNSQANRNLGCPFKPRMMIFTDRSSNQAYLCPMYRGRIFSLVQHLHIPEENYVNEDGVLLRTSYINISGRNYTVTAYRGE